jgi:hypothetical protein
MRGGGKPAAESMPIMKMRCRAGCRNLRLNYLGRTEKARPELGYQYE